MLKTEVGRNFEWASVENAAKARAVSRARARTNMTARDDPFHRPTDDCPPSQAKLIEYKGTRPRGQVFRFPRKSSHLPVFSATESGSVSSKT